MNRHIELSANQTKCIQLAKEMKSFVINGYSGCGKTETLIQIAHTLEDMRGIYIGFNKYEINHIRQKLPENTSFTTFHALASYSVPVHLKVRSKTKHLSLREMAHKYGLLSTEHPFSKEYLHEIKHKSYGRFKALSNAQTRTSSPSEKMKMIHNAVRSFCRSTDTYLKPDHFDRPLWMHEDDYEYIANELTPIAQELWNEMIGHNSNLPISHDVYLKYWLLSNPVLDFDYILIDDYNEGYSLLDQFIANQKATCVIAKDDYQQLDQWYKQPTKINYSNLYSVNLTESFVSGKSITAHTNLLLSAMGANTPIHSNLNNGSRLLFQKDMSIIPDAIISNTHIGAFCELVKMQNKFPQASYAVAFDRKNVEMWLDGAQQLIKERKSYHPELSMFRSWNEAVECIELNKSDAAFSLFIKLVNSYVDDLSPLYSILDDEYRNLDDADCAIFVAERVRGLKWESVALADDFDLELMTYKFFGINQTKVEKSDEIYLENWDLIAFPETLKLIPIKNSIQSYLLNSDICPKMAEQRYRIGDITVNTLKKIYIALASAKSEFFVGNAVELFIILEKLKNNLD